VYLQILTADGAGDGAQHGSDAGQARRIGDAPGDRTVVGDAEVHHVDSGYHVLGMKRPEAPDISLSKD
jgi:hypothetical protein